MLIPYKLIILIVFVFPTKCPENKIELEKDTAATEIPKNLLIQKSITLKRTVIYKQKKSIPYIHQGYHFIHPPITRKEKIYN